jgi:predicted RNase H-like HicB family nuclease
MVFPIVIHKDRKSDYGVTVPDLPGCFSAGSTMDEALSMAKEAVELHLEGLIEEGQPVPEPLPIERHKRKPEYADGVWAMVEVEPSGLFAASKRVNITLPKRVLDSIDRFASSKGETRSGMLVKAAAAYMAAHKKSHRGPD